MKTEETILAEADKCTTDDLEFMLMHFQISLGRTSDPKTILDLSLHIKIYEKVMIERKLA